MRAFAVMVLLVGLGLAGGAAFYAHQQVRAAEARLQDSAPSVTTVGVVVARRQLDFGARLTPDDVALVQWPEAHLPATAFRDLSDVASGDDGAPARTVLRRMEPNEPVLASKVTGFGEGATVASLLDPGMLAYSLSVDAVNSVGGFLLPGTRIDVFLTVPDRDAGPTTRLLMQNLKVVAVDQTTDPEKVEAKVASTVTVQGTPAQVRELTLGASLGSFSIALRGFGSTEMTELAPLTRRGLLGEPEPEIVAEAPPEPEPEPEISVRVRRGNEVETRVLR